MRETGEFFQNGIRVPEFNCVLACYRSNEPICGILMFPSPVLPLLDFLQDRLINIDLTVSRGVVWLFDTPGLATSGQGHKTSRGPAMPQDDHRFTRLNEVN